MIDCLIYCEIPFFKLYTLLFVNKINKKQNNYFSNFFYDIGVGSE